VSGARGRWGRVLAHPAFAPLAAISGGLVGGLLVARWVDIPLGSLGELVGLSVVGTLGVIGVGYLVERLMRARRVAVAKLAAFGGAVTAAAALAGLGLGALAMMASHHELAQVLVLVPVTAGVGMAYGLLTARHTAADLEDLAVMARRLEAGDLAARVEPHGSAEVAEVARALSAAAARLQAGFDRERAMEASRRDLVAWASHDLRTPLASLRAVAEALADDLVADDAGRRRYLDSLVAQVDRLAGLVDDLFELSQIEAGALVLNFEPTNLPSLVAEVLTAFEPGAVAAGVALRADLPDRTRLVPAGRDQVGRVLANLVANGIRHTARGGRVLVAVADRPGTAVMRVTDGCGGIAEADLSRVFDRLWRADPARSSGGAGLGLAIARGLVEAHGGRISVANVAGGCQFTVELPMAARPGRGARPTLERAD
jgi:signal transduction histidine kinase